VQKKSTGFLSMTNLYALKGTKDFYEALKTVPGWQERIREYIDVLIAEEIKKKPS
jgi:hypothetical protein